MVETACAGIPTVARHAREGLELAAEGLVKTLGREISTGLKGRGANAKPSFPLGTYLK